MPYPHIHIDFSQVPSPCYVLEEARLRANLEVLDRVQREAGVKVICALKGFSMWSTFPIVREYLPGATASSLNEALLAHQKMGGEIHVYAPAYREAEIGQILDLADHISFNSFAQWLRFRERVLAHPRHPSPGLRVNPGFSEVEVELYNPCAPGSRLGIPLEEFRPELLEGIEGLHFHALCEQNVGVLEKVLQAFEARFGRFISKMKWINFGGGHHITREDYDVDRLIQVLRAFRARYPQVQMILEPGEAVGWRTGELVSTVEDIVRNGMEIAILDVSVSAHMPDCLEMPYRPQIIGGEEPEKLPYTYRLGGGTCLAGDVVGDYSFATPLQVGNRIIFLDMIHYTMVKTTFFNGVHHPSIGIWGRDSRFRLVREFTYEQFRDKLS
ncbi:MAG TPA: carboxynorspermidine decarboxylase [Fibrobacteraceae bacterium]|nr:carboxynorspermidine decarboxylase [Fibrobacteraceae bacterium]